MALHSSVFSAPVCIHKNESVLIGLFGGATESCRVFHSVFEHLLDIRITIRETRDASFLSGEGDEIPKAIVEYQQSFPLSCVLACCLSDFLLSISAKDSFIARWCTSMSSSCAELERMFMDFGKEDWRTASRHDRKAGFRVLPLYQCV
jgi:hypothetical protein